MIATATNMLNSKILDVLINMNSSKTSTNTAIGTRRTYRTIVDEVAVGAATVAARRRRRWRRAAREPGDRPGSRAVMKNLKAVARSASQKPYSPSPVQDHKDERFRRPAVPFAGARRRTGWSRLRWRRKARDWQNLDWFG